MPEISIVIPVYNAETYLVRCLESLLAQSFTAWEALLVDDGSTDTSLDIMNKYAEADLRFRVVSQKNAGQSAARNKALTLAQGKYLSFIDADDWIDKNFLQKLFTAAEQNGADIAFASIIKVKGAQEKDKLRLQDEKVYETAAEKYKAFGMPQNCFIWNKLYRREAADFSFAEGMYYEDIVFSHEILWKTGRAVSVPGTAYYYFSNPGSTVNVFSEQKKKDYAKALKLAAAVMSEHGMKADICAYVPIVKKDYKFLGLKLWSVKDWGMQKAFYLFGFLKLMQVKD